MAESSVLVEHFEDLELGWTVVLTACKQCGADHELQLAAYNPNAQGWDARTSTYTALQPVFVGTSADGAHDGRIGIFASAVAEKRVYRVIDDDSSEMPIMLAGNA